MSAFVGDIYQAAYDPSAWKDVIQNLQALFHGSKACMARLGPDMNADDAVASNTDQSFQARFMAEFPDEPAILIDAISTVPVGKLFSEHKLIGREKLRRTPLFSKWMAPQDMYGGISCKVLQTGPSFWFFDVQRGRKQEYFSQTDQKAFQFLVPHLRRSVEISHQFQTRQALGLAFSHLPFGVVLVDANQRIVTMNESADRILTSAGNPLQSKNGHLVAANMKTGTMMSRLIEQACAVRPSQPRALGGDFQISYRARDGSLTLSVSVGPLMRRPTLMFERCAVVIIRELHFDVPEGFTDHICAVFGFTPKEAAIAAALTSGRSLKDAASSAGIQFSTARSHLERIFRKSGTHQQSQLVALLKSTQSVMR